MESRIKPEIPFDIGCLMQGYRLMYHLKNKSHVWHMTQVYKDTHHAAQTQDQVHNLIAHNDCYTIDRETVISRDHSGRHCLPVHNPCSQWHRGQDVRIFADALSKGFSGDAYGVGHVEATLLHGPRGRGCPVCWSPLGGNKMFRASRTCVISRGSSKRGARIRLLTAAPCQNQRDHWQLGRRGSEHYGKADYDIGRSAQPYVEFIQQICHQVSFEWLLQGQRHASNNLVQQRIWADNEWQWQSWGTAILRASVQPTQLALVVDQYCLSLWKICRPDGSVVNWHRSLPASRCFSHSTKNVSWSKTLTPQELAVCCGVESSDNRGLPMYL